MLWYKTVGSGNDLVLLHGWGFNSDIFKDINISNYKTTFIDLPGHGRSSVIDGNIDEWANKIITLIPNNSTIMGWSLGGLIAIKIAQKIQVKKLILLASTPCFVTNSSWQYGIKREVFLDFYQNLKQNTEKMLKQFTILQSNNPKQAKNLYQQIIKYQVKQPALKIGLDILLNNNLSKELLKIDSDVEAILGRKDQLVPINITKWYQVNNIKTTVYNSGHLPFLNTDFKL